MSALRFDVTWAAIIARRRRGDRVLPGDRAVERLVIPWYSSARARAEPRADRRDRTPFAGADSVSFRRSAACAAAEERGPRSDGAPQQRRAMRKQARVLGLVSAALLFAACSGTTATPAPPPGAARRRRRSQAPASSAPASPAAEAAERPAAAPVGAAGPVRRLLRGQGQGYYEAEGLDVTIARRRPDGRPAAGRLGARRPRVHDLLGARRSSRPARPAPTSSTSPRSSSARARCRVTWKDSGIDDTCKLAGKKVGVWDFGNEFEVTAGLSQLRPDAGPRERGDPARSTSRSSRTST